MNKIKVSIGNCPKCGSVNIEKISAESLGSTSLQWGYNSEEQFNCNCCGSMFTVSNTISGYEIKQL